MSQKKGLKWISFPSESALGREATSRKYNFWLRNRTDLDRHPVS